MATERFIRGKKDSANHDGLYSNTKRLEEACYQLDVEGEQILASMRIWQQRDKWAGLGEEFLNYHRGILETYGLLEGGE